MQFLCFVYLEAKLVARVADAPKLLYRAQTDYTVRGQAATQATKLENGFFVSKPELRILIVYDWIRYIFKISRNRGGEGRCVTRQNRFGRRQSEILSCEDVLIL